MLFPRDWGTEKRVSAQNKGTGADLAVDDSGGNRKRKHGSSTVASAKRNLKAIHSEPPNSVSAHKRSKDDPFAFQVCTNNESRNIDKPVQGKTVSGGRPENVCGYTTENVTDIYDAIRHSVTRQMQMELTESVIELDTILSRVSYREMLETLFGSDNSLLDDVVVVSRVYEESYMRECVSKDEKACVMGRNCECMFIDPNLPFIATEFLMPGEQSSVQAQLCVVCCRKVTQQLFHDMLYNGVQFQGLIQRFGNICDQPGEYARECMLICPPNANIQCMPLPIVAHQRNRYSVRICSGVKYLKQSRVYYEHYNPVQSKDGSEQPFH